MVFSRSFLFDFGLNAVMEENNTWCQIIIVMCFSLRHSSAKEPGMRAKWAENKVFNNPRFNCETLIFIITFHC